MKIDQSKLKRQKEIVSKWIKNFCHGTVEAVTGFGKTFTVIIGAKHLFKTLVKKEKLESLKEKTDYSIVVVAPTNYLKDKWTQDLKQHKLDKFGEVRVDTVHNLVKEDLSTILLVLDELHLYVGEEAEVFPKIFDKVKARAIFGATATLGKEGIMRELADSYCPVIDTVTMEEALDNGWVSDHMIYNLAVDLTESDRRAYEKVSKQFNKYFSTFDYDFNRAMRCVKSEEAREEWADSINWDIEIVSAHAFQFIRKMKERKKMLYEASAKIDVASQIVSRLSDRKIITFSQSTEFADKLAEEIGERALVYHSSLPTEIRDETDEVFAKGVKVDKPGGGQKTLYETIHGDRYSWKELKEAFPDRKFTRMGSKRLRKEILRVFGDNRYKQDVLCTAKALDVGYDEEDITAGIIASGSSKFRQNIQRSGRVIRAKPGKQAIIVNLYIRDTQDETWLQKRQKDAPNVRWITRIDQIAA